MKDTDTLTSEFIGVSEEECKEWVLRHETKNAWIEWNLLVIADERSARDGTVLLAKYVREPMVLGPEDPGTPFPSQGNRWYDFRIRYEDAAQVYSDLCNGPIDGVYPVYYERKDELEDKNGVFDVGKAGRMIVEL